MARRRVMVTAFAAVLAATGLGIVPDAVRTPAASDPPPGGTTIVSETFTGSSVADPAWTAQNDSA